MLIDIKGRDLILATMALIFIVMVVFLIMNDFYDDIVELTIQQNEVLRLEILRLSSEERILKIIIETTMDTDNVIIRRFNDE